MRAVNVHRIEFREAIGIFWQRCSKTQLLELLSQGRRCCCHFVGPQREGVFDIDTPCMLAASELLWPRSEVMQWMSWQSEEESTHQILSAWLCWGGR